MELGHRRARAHFQHRSLTAAFALVPIACVALLPAAAGALVLDFGAALQSFEAGEKVGTVRLETGATMRVTVDNNDNDHPDLAIVFDSADPSGDDVDLGTPNEDFDGPGEGDGGERGAKHENSVALGKILIIAGNDDDLNYDGLADDPDDEPSGGVVRLQFSHTGRLSLTLIDVDDKEDEPRIVLFKEGHVVDEVLADHTGDNGVEHLDLGESGEIDAAEIHLEGSAGIAAIQLDVMLVGSEPQTWSKVKGSYR